MRFAEFEVESRKDLERIRISPAKFISKKRGGRGDPHIQALAVINIHVREIDGHLYPLQQKYEQSIAIFDGKKHIPIVEFFDEILAFWTEELLDRFKFKGEFSFDWMTCKVMIRPVR